MERGIRFVMELLRSTGQTVGHAPLDPDWEPAIEWTRLAGLRTRGVWAPDAAAERGVEPLWHTTRGEPDVRGFRVHFRSREGEAWFEDFPITYFRAEARAASARLVEQGALESGESFLYRLAAYPGLAPAAPAPASAFVTEDAPAPLAVIDTPLDTLMAASAPAHADVTDTLPVFIPQAVIEEATALTIAAGESEAGGVLIGHLHRASEPSPGGAGREIFVEVTALVPARHTVGSSTKLTFTSDTWTDARTAIQLRNRCEQLLGWYHSHPQFAWCAARGCSPEAQRSCTRAAGFLSEEDCLLHRMMFPRAFTLALLMTRTIGGCVPALFGWQHGVLAERGFRVIGGPASPADSGHRDTIPQALLPAASACSQTTT
jgi:hypothetical protein